MGLSRRNFLGLSAGALGAATFGGCGSSSNNVLTQPSSSSPPQDGVVEVALTAQQTPYTLNGSTVNAPTFNGQIPSPTIRVKPGDQLRVLVSNDLPVPVMAQTVNQPSGPNITNLHVHGLHVSPMVPSDDIFLEIDSGEEFQYIYDIPANHPAGTFFYHPHRHGSVAPQMWGGMGGALIVEGAIDQVPEVAAARDLLFMMQEIRVQADGFQPVFNELFVPFLIAAPPQFPVNGSINPTIEARPGEVIRLRILHGGVADYLDFGIDGHELHILALDGITLSQVETAEHILLAPANRAEVLVRAGQPGTYQIHKLPYNQGFGPSDDLVIATLVVSGEPMDMALPTALPAPFANIADDEITGTRALTFDTLPPSGLQPIATFAINGDQFSPTKINQIIELGAVEEWTVTNTSFEDHPIHIHVNPFLVMQIGDTVLNPPRWMDTVNLPPFTSVRLRSRFLDFPGRYVLHCHIIIHECLGMMEVVDVVEPGLSQLEQQKRVASSRKLLEHVTMRAMQKPSDEFCSLPQPQRRLRWGGPQPS